jgi:hypothetical protein
VGITGHLYLKLIAYVNSSSHLSPTARCYLRWFHGDYHRCQEEEAATKMAPTIGDICKDDPKDSDDIVKKERPKLLNTQGEQNLNANLSS